MPDAVPPTETAQWVDDAARMVARALAQGDDAVARQLYTVMHGRITIAALGLMLDPDPDLPVNAAVVRTVLRTLLACMDEIAATDPAAPAVGSVDPANNDDDEPFGFDRQ